MTSFKGIPKFPLNEFQDNFQRYTSKSDPAFTYIMTLTFMAFAHDMEHMKHKFFKGENRLIKETTRKKKSVVACFPNISRGVFLKHSERKILG